MYLLQTAVLYSSYLMYSESLINKLCADKKKKNKQHIRPGLPQCILFFFFANLLRHLPLMNTGLGIYEKHLIEKKLSFRISRKISLKLIMFGGPIHPIILYQGMSVSVQ